jgi:hypothetical protein
MLGLFTIEGRRPYQVGLRSPLDNTFKASEQKQHRGAAEIAERPNFRTMRIEQQ